MIKKYKMKQWIILPILALITGICLVGWQTQGIAQSASQPALTLSKAQLILEEVGTGIYALIADSDFPNDQPEAAVCNGGIIIGDDGVLVIDPFQTKALGNLLLNTVKTVTDQPIRYVLNTHFHFDHTGGNSAIVAQSIPIIGKGPIRQLMLEKNREYDPNPMPPSLIINEDSELWLGDRQVILKMAEGHTMGTDLFAYIPDAKVMFTGDILFNQRFPYIADGNIRKWQNTLITLKEKYPDVTFIPGHGPITDSMGLDKLKAYLDRLESLAMTWKEKNIEEEQAINSATTIPDIYQDYKFKALYNSNLKTAYQQITLEN